MRQLSGNDAMILAADRPHAQNLIAPLNIYDPSTAGVEALDFEDVLAFVDARLTASESFRERLVNVPLGLDRPYWLRDPDFDLEYHVRQLALPRPGDWRQFCVQIARLGARPLDLTRPPWELYIIEGLDAIQGVPRGSFAVMLKHHAAGDGGPGPELMSVLHDASPSFERPTDVDEWSPEDLPSSVSLLARAGVHLVARPVGSLPSIPGHLARLPGALRDLRSRAPQATRFNHPVTNARVFGARLFPLDTVKRIRSLVPEAKVNDVALALVSGALRRYLDDKGELPADSLVALVPMSLHPAAKRRVGTSDEQRDWSSRFKMALVPLATHLDDPRGRVETIQAATAAAKSDDAMGAQALVELSEVLPGELFGSAQRALVRTMNRSGRAAAVHTIVANMPGPQMPVYFCGAKAVLMTGMTPISDGVGLANCVGSYGGGLPVSFTADREMMPDPDFYEQCLEESYAELAELAPPPPHSSGGSRQTTAAHDST
jgi:diacylglycerol O-acyltransferase / wax synthase